MRGYAVPVSLLALVLGCSLTACGEARSPVVAQPDAVPTTSPTSSTTPARPATPLTTPSTARPGQCHANQLRLAVALSASLMSQPFADISVTNTGARSCVLRGYPRITAAGHRGFGDQHAPAVPVAITVCHCHGLYERVDPGPHRVVVAPGHRVFFSVGTADAFDGPLVTLTRLTVVLPGTRSAKVVPVSLLANAPPGHRIGVGITAITTSPHP